MTQMRKIKIQILLILLCLATTHAIAKDLHVSVSAPAGGTGTETAPFKTIQAAASVAKPGDNVVIHAGTYCETVIPAFSGTANARITYMPYNNDLVIIDGTDSVTNWTKHSGNIYRAKMSWDLGAENQVFVNDKMAHLARWPNVSEASIDDPFFVLTNYSAAQTGSNATKIIDAKLPVKPDNFYKGCTLWACFGVKWTSFGTTISASTGNTLTYPSTNNKDHAPFSNSYGNFISTDKELYFLSGKYELLDSPNEWYLDSVKDSLYLMVNAGVDPNTSVKVKSRKIALNLNNRSYITVMNIHVFGAAITMSNANYCTLDGINAKFITHHSLANVKLYEISYVQLLNRNGIDFSGQGDTIKNCVIKYSAGCGVKVKGQNHIIDNNDIQYCNYVGQYCEGINSTDGASNNIRITRNKIWYAGGPLINCFSNQNNTKGNKVFYNDLAYGELLGDDRGGVNGSNYEVAYNWVHDLGAGLAHGIVPGLYTDVSSDYATYHHNVVWNLKYNKTAHILINNTGSPANGNQGIFVYNNTGWGAGWEQTMTAGLWQSIITDKNNLCNPSAATFVDASKFDFRLRSTASNAIDKALIIPGFTDGYIGTKPDLGAYEYGSADGSSDWKAGIGVEMYYPVNTFPSGIELNNPGNSTASVYPNPSSQILNFKNIEMGSRILICNITGAIVLEQVLTEPRISISRLQPGVYILKVYYNDERFCTIKIVKN
jgi:hypothetical protein